MNQTQRKQYLRALAQAYQLAKLDCEFGVVDPDSDANYIAGLWENAAMKLVQDGTPNDYDWVISQAKLVDSRQWAS